MECYKEVVNMLETIYAPAGLNTTQQSFNTSMNGRDPSNVPANNNILVSMSE